MTIPYRPFGRTGVQVSALALGAMNFGGRGNPSHEDGVRIIHRALDAGVNILDTADVYSRGESEVIVGKALAGRRDDVFLATKFHGRMGEDVNRFGNSRRWIIRAVEASLTRLGTDHIDLYQVHRPEEDTDFDETLGALSDLVHQGKVRYLGTSTFPPSRIVEGQWTAQRRGLERVVSEQPAASGRAEERSTVHPVCAGVDRRAPPGGTSGCPPADVPVGAGTGRRCAGPRATAANGRLAAPPSGTEDVYETCAQSSRP